MVILSCDNMKNKYFTYKFLLACLIVFMSLLAFRYYQHKMNLLSGASGTEKEDNPSHPIQKPENNGNTIDDEAKKHLGKNSGEIGLKTPTTFAEFDALVKRDADAMFVFGRTGCGYCENYYPVLEDVANSEKIEIIYINLANLSEEHYQAVLNADITIPGRCVKEGVDKKLVEGFGTPLSLFINKGETYNCIRGYKNKTDLLKTLKKAGYIR